MSANRSSANRSRSRHARPQGRTSTWVRIGVTGVVLGLVIVGAGALMNRPVTPAPQGPSTPATSTVETTPGAATTTTPSVVPTTVPSTTDTSSTDPGTSATFTVDAWDQPVTSLAVLLPKKVAGYNVGLVETTKLSAIVPLEPTTGGPEGKATIVVLTVFDKKTAAGAQSYVDKFQKAYPKDLSVVEIGTMIGRFGTDGSHLAAAVFSRGRYAFEIVLTVTRGAPRNLESVVVQAAEAFGATKTAP
jgi:hypothetical protein